MAENNTKAGKFSTFLADFARGSLDDEITDQLTELVREMTRISETSGGKPKGKLTLSVEFVLDRGVMDVNPKLNVTRPTPLRARAVMYPTRDGGLSSQDESQHRLALSGEVRDVSPDIKDIRTAAPRS